MASKNFTQGPEHSWGRDSKGLPSPPHTPLTPVSPILLLPSPFRKPGGSGKPNGRESWGVCSIRWESRTGAHRGTSPCCHGHCVFAGRQNISIKGCGTPNLCSISKIPDSQFSTSWLSLQRVHCDDKSRVVLGKSGHIGATPGLHLALPMLLVALGTALS